MDIEDNPRGIGRPVGITLDCQVPDELADFYRALTGWAVTHSSDDVVVLGEGPIRLALRRLPEHRPPTWPGPDKQVHLDFATADLHDAEERLVALGGTKPDFQPGGDSWLVLQDPAGHPFCLSLENDV